MVLAGLNKCTLTVIKQNMASVPPAQGENDDIMSVRMKDVKWRKIDSLVCLEYHPQCPLLPLRQADLSRSPAQHQTR